MSQKSIPAQEALIIDGLKRGDEHFFRLLFDTYYKSLVAFANRMLLDIDLSRSIVQDVFVMLYDKREEINIHTSLNAHLYQSVKNRCLNHIKRDKMKNRHHDILLENSETVQAPTNSLEYNELENLIRSTIENMPDRCKEIFRMSRFEGRSNQEIADKLGISKRTVETQISNALKILREELSKYRMLPAFFCMVVFFLI